MQTQSLDYQRLIVGYHGCDRETLERVLLYGESLYPSVNPYDWLGNGVYFWEYGPQRALEFAYEQQLRGKIQNPAVLGAYIHLGRCFDLTDTQNTYQLSNVFTLWSQTLHSQELRLPVNRKGKNGGDDILLRFRDCALLNWYMEQLDCEGKDGYYQTIRGVFVEGEPVYEGAAIYTKTHVQIAVREQACILGYFAPNPLEHKDEDDE
ncbi:MAG: hypothetical protein EP343_07000 [Deltaproteobacteria bacterium]|nr:MAG: hypothetical protein EP343_07000 [Deltaproteobacteria bacterium]